MIEDNKKVQFIRVLEPQQGQRIDNFLIRHLKGVPRSRIYRLVRRGEVRINKKRCKPAQKLEAGDEVRIPPFSGVTAAPPKKLGLGMRQLLEKSVLFENDQVLVINKPAGLAVHGGSNIRLGLIEALRQINPQWPELELAHRLDRDTSGCIIISKNTLFLRYIHRKFKEKSLIGLQGLGCVTYPEFIRNEQMLGGKIGLYEVDHPLAGYEVRNDFSSDLAAKILEEF